MGKLYYYFGAVGIASIVCWATALLVLIGGVRSSRRTRLYGAAFALSLIGFILAKANSHSISNIQIDRTELLAEMREKQRALQDEQEKEPQEPTAAPVRSTEETPGEATDKAGTKAKEGESAEPNAPEAKEAPEYDYRTRGKQERAKGKKRKLELIPGVAEVKGKVTARTMPEADVIAADRLDRVNLFAARLVPWLAFLMVCFDYLSRFNKTSGYLYPLPVACRAVDAVFPKTHSVYLQTGRAGAAKGYLEDAVRKGETFIYFGPADPWQASELHRLRLKHRNLWPLRKILYGSQEASNDSGFVFDAVWFGRYCFVVTEAKAAENLVGELIDYLRRRRIPRAAAWRTVHLLWDFDSPLPKDVLDELSFLCKEANFKLTVVSASPPADDIAPLFEERIEMALSP